MVSAVNIDQASKAVREAWLIVLKECQTRKCEDELSRVKLHRLLHTLEQLKLDFIDFETSTFGFEFWRPIEQENQERKRRQLANYHCEQLGLKIPYPDERTPESETDADGE